MRFAWKKNNPRDIKCYLAKRHKDFFADNDDRKKTWRRLIELEGTEEEIITLGGKLKKIHKQICDQAD